MENISEEELDWLADKLYQWAKDDEEFKVIEIQKFSRWREIIVTFSFKGTRYGSVFEYEQNKEQRTA